jgi:transposase InsO family protein
MMKHTRRQGSSKKAETPRSRKSHKESLPGKKPHSHELTGGAVAQLPSETGRTDELDEEQLEVFSQNCWLVSLVNNGIKIKEALRRLGINRSERSVRDLMRRYRKYGRHGLFDQRWFRRTEAVVLTSEVKKLALAVYFEYPAAGPRAVWKELGKICRERGLDEPGESTVFKFLDSLPEAFKMFRQGKPGVRKWEQTAAPVVRYENTTFANQRWHGDHSPLRIWVRARVGGEWRAFIAYISALLDARSRSVAGFVVSIKYPDSWTIALLFYRAIMPKRRKTWLNRGVPFAFQSDRGKDFLSRAVTSTLGQLKVNPDPGPAHYPNDNGKVERWFETLDTGCLRILPGHMDAIGTSEGAAAKRVNEFLTVPQLTAEIERWIDEEYHRHKHSETGRKPAELWEETVRLRMPEQPDDLNLLFLKDDVERTVRNTGIRITMDGVKRIYWSPTLMYHFQERVRIAYNPEDAESVLVYCAATGKYICEAFNMRAEHPRYTVRDVLRERSMFRRGMKDRIKDYMDEVYREDRRVARVDEWEEARRQALAAQEAPTQRADAPDRASEVDEDVMALIEKFRRRDRGED